MAVSGIRAMVLRTVLEELLWHGTSKDQEGSLMTKFEAEKEALSYLRALGLY